MSPASPEMRARAATLSDAELRHRLETYLEGGKPGYTLPVLLEQVLIRWRGVSHH